MKTNMKSYRNTEVINIVRDRIIALVERKGVWEGSMTELNSAITTGSRKTANVENWPGSPSILRRVVNRVAPQLRKAGLKVAFSRETDHFRKRVVSFTQR
jgi:hypothetical protein